MFLYTQKSVKIVPLTFLMHDTVKHAYSQGRAILLRYTRLQYVIK